MAEWYRNSDGWEDGHEHIDLGYDGAFIAYRRKVLNGEVIYEGDFRDATTGEKVAAFLIVLIDEDNINHWMHAEIIPMEEEADQEAGQK